MKSHNKIYLPLCAVALAMGMTACSSTTGKDGQKTISVTPRVPTLLPDSTGSVDMNLTISVPPHYFSSRSRLIIVPQLHDSAGVLEEFAPVALDAPIYSKKLNRLEKLYDFQDSLASSRQAVKSTGKAFTIPYQARVTLPEGPQTGRRVYGVVTTDGCGECSAMDTVLLAAIDDPVDMLKRKYDLKWMEPEFAIKPKIREGRGTARIQFVINRYDIRPQLGNNRAELDTMLARLRPVVNDSLAELTSVKIYGLTSADGPLSFNTPLARNRANAAMKWLCDQLHLTAAQRQVFTTGSRPEGWEPVVQAMRVAGDKDSVKVRAILDKYAGQNDDVAEKYIRRLDCWPTIRAKYLQKDRKVDYVYTYRVKNFTTDEELLRMYETRPDAFSEIELLRVATLKNTPQEKQEVYRTTLHYFPQSVPAANNLAILLLRERKAYEAERVLKEAEAYTPEALNTLAAAYTYQNKYEEAAKLLSRIERDEDIEGRYNLGLIKACQHQYEEAYQLLTPYQDVATAIVALCLNRNGEAEAIMNGSAAKDLSPLACYVRAQVAARQGKADQMFNALTGALEDSWFRQRALENYDFTPYHEDERWAEVKKQ